MLTSAEMDHINKYMVYYFNNDEKVSNVSSNKICFLKHF